MSDLLRIVFLIAVPIYLVMRGLNSVWVKNAPIELTKSARTGGLWGMGLGILVLGVDNIHESVRAQITIEIVLGALCFIFAYSMVWIFKNKKIFVIIKILAGFLWFFAALIVVVFYFWGKSGFSLDTASPEDASPVAERLISDIGMKEKFNQVVFVEKSAHNFPDYEVRFVLMVPGKNNEIINKIKGKCLAKDVCWKKDGKNT